jgi:hypothetical protein
LCYAEPRVSAIALTFILLFQGQIVPGTGIVTGQLRTVDGSPAVAVRVAAMPVPTSTADPADGVQYFVFPPAESTTLSDNRGRYQLRNVPPGRYFIMAGAMGDPTYYPAASAIEKATVVNVGSGATTPNIDFKLLKRYGGKLTGRVIPNTGASQLKATLLGGQLEELLDVPIDANGTFEFGHVPPGTYLLGLFPRPPGMSSVSVKVGDADLTGIELLPPPTRAVTGRIVVQNGPLPHSLLGFASGQSYVGATINPDGTFSTRLHSTTHHVDLAGMPVGYSVASVHLGSEDVSQGFAVRDADISGLVITVTAPRRLPRLTGSIAGLAPNRAAATKVEMTGPVIGLMQAAVQPNGSFEFPAVVPGTYQLSLTEVPQFRPISVVVAGWEGTKVDLVVK